MEKTMRFLWLLVVFMAIWVQPARAQMTLSLRARPVEQNSPTGTRSSTKNDANSGHLDAMQSELNRMRTLLSQMQMNLPFVAATENPLKHQFELEIDMWGLLLNQLQRQLDAMRPDRR